MKKVEEKVWTEADVAKVLHVRYSSPEWAFLTRVRNQTGFSRDVRTADAVAMNLYPSRGMEINGFEIKVSRSDVMHELMQPDKSAEIQQFCHKWWLVVSDPKIVEGLQIPITWGVIEVSKGKCKIMKTAPDLKPKMMTREFIASLFRNVCEGFVHPEDVAERIEVAKNNAVYGMNQEYRDLKELEKNVREFEKESGVKVFEKWNHKGGEIGKAVAFVLSGKKDMKWKCESALTNVNDIAKRLEALNKEL